MKMNSRGDMGTGLRAGWCRWAHRMSGMVVAGLLMLPAMAPASGGTSAAGIAGQCTSLPETVTPKGGEVVLQICDGDGQVTSAGTPFAQALTVRLEAWPSGPAAGAKGGAVLPFVEIDFEVIPAANGAGATPAQATVVTDQDGIASLVLTANAIPGQFRCRPGTGQGHVRATALFNLSSIAGGSVPVVHTVPSASAPVLVAGAGGAAGGTATLRCARPIWIEPDRETGARRKPVPRRTSCFHVYSQVSLRP